MKTVLINLIYFRDLKLSCSTFFYLTPNVYIYVKRQLDIV